MHEQKGQVGQCVHIVASLLAFFKDWDVIPSNKEYLHDLLLC